MPLFSILIPTKGRPLYARDAVLSVFHQDFDDVDVTLSNNGADPATKAALAEFMGNPRFHYIEQPDVLDMPTHWEVACRSVRGDNFLVLTDISVLKQGALRKIAKLFTGQAGACELASWRWDSYDNASGLLSPGHSNTDTMQRLRTSDELLSFARGSNFMNQVYTLPGGTNSCVSRAVIERIRKREGLLFQKITPDYRFAFSCLLNTTELVHFDEALFIRQGPEVSNGINSVRGDARPYMNSLGLAAPWEDVPIKAALVHNAIAQYFLATLRKYGRTDIRAEWNTTIYYLHCLGEIRLKKNGGILSASEIDELKSAVDMALQNEDKRVRASVYPSFARMIRNKTRTLARLAGRSAADLFRPHRHQSGGKLTFPTALEAAGFGRR